MNISAAGIAFTQSKETCCLHPYPDASGASIGWGHFLRPGDALYPACRAVLARGLVGNALRAALAAVGTWTQQEADDAFANDMRPCAASVNACVSARITQPQFDALCDFAYNEGLGALPGSTLLKYLNAGNYAMAADHFLEWDKDVRDGVLSDDPVLEARRQAERAMFLSELPPEPAA